MPPTKKKQRPVKRAPASRARTAPALVDLALQGGGSHGAFTWGVLDRLLEERGCRSTASPAPRPAR